MYYYYLTNPSAMDPELTFVFYATAGVAVGAGAAAATVVVVPVAIGAGTGVLVSTTSMTLPAAYSTSVAVTTGTLFVAGAAGTISTGVGTYQACNAGNWNQVAFNVGTLGGGALVGVVGGGSQMLSLACLPNPMKGVWNPVTLATHEGTNVFIPTFAGGQSPFFSVNFLSTAPTASSGMFCAATAYGNMIWVDYLMTYVYDTSP